jgi:hypothetical protein
VKILSVTGGVPKYLEEIDPKRGESGFDPSRRFPPSRASCASAVGWSPGGCLVSIQQAINEGAERRLRVATMGIVEVEAGTGQ